MLTSDISTAIKSAVKDLGNDILKSPTIVSILSDYHAFNVHDPLLAEKKSAITILAASKYVDKMDRTTLQKAGIKEECCRNDGRRYERGYRIRSILYRVL